MACAFCYYGVVLLSTEILGGHRNALPVFSNVTDRNSTTAFAPLFVANGTSECRNPGDHMLTPTDYVDLLWTTLAEFPGIFYNKLIV
jgi:hypothetical protein